MFDVDTLVTLYRRHADDLRRARDAQRELLAQRPVRPRLDDIEAEIVYLVLRECRPHDVVEFGGAPGWSSSWILRALRDNGHGRLHTFGQPAGAIGLVPADLAAGRWTLVPGDVRTNEHVLPGQPGFVFVDQPGLAVGFARWYTHWFLGLRAGTPVGVHDVFHARRPWPGSAGRHLLDWLRRRHAGYLTPSRAADPDLYERLVLLKRKLTLAAPVHGSRRNPTLFFRIPS